MLLFHTCYYNKSLTWSTAIILAQIKANIGRSSTAKLCNSFSMYGNIPTDKVKFTAHGPKSKNLPNKSNARSLCA